MTLTTWPRPPQVNLRLAMCLRFQTRYHYMAIYGSVALWLLFVLVYSELPLGLLGSIAHQDNIYNAMLLLIGWPVAWLVIPLGEGPRLEGLGFRV